jgi:hypothetical protein
MQFIDLSYYEPPNDGANGALSFCKCQSNLVEAPVGGRFCNEPRLDYNGSGGLLCWLLRHY